MYWLWNILIMLFTYTKLSNPKAASNAMEVMLAAKAFSIGITKLPGSSPFWKVKMEMAKDSRTIKVTAMTFATIKVITWL